MAKNNNTVTEMSLWTVRGKTHRRDLRDGYLVVSPDPGEPANDDGTPWWQWEAFKAGQDGRSFQTARQRYFRTAAAARVHAGETMAGDQIVTRYAAADSPGEAIDLTGRSLTSRDPFGTPGVALHPDDIPARERARRDVYRVRFGTCFTITGLAFVRDVSKAGQQTGRPRSPLSTRPRHKEPGGLSPG